MLWLVLAMAAAADLALLALTLAAVVLVRRARPLLAQFAPMLQMFREG